MADLNFLGVAAGAAITVYDDSRTTVYDDSGTIVYDDSGTIVAVGTGTLATGQSVPDPHGTPIGDCVTAFTVPGLPDRPFCQVEIAHRGRVTVEKADLSAVILQLGG